MTCSLEEGPKEQGSVEAYINTNQKRKERIEYYFQARSVQSERERECVCVLYLLPTERPHTRCIKIISKQPSPFLITSSRKKGPTTGLSHLICSSLGWPLLNIWRISGYSTINFPQFVTLDLRVSLFVLRKIVRQAQRQSSLLSITTGSHISLVSRVQRSLREVHNTITRNNRCNVTCKTISTSTLPQDSCLLNTKDKYAQVINQPKTL